MKKYTACSSKRGVSSAARDDSRLGICDVIDDEYGTRRAD
jgi:hypothetical protein